MLLAFSMVYILKLKWTNVVAGTIITAASAFAFASPMVPMLVGIAALSIITLLDKNDPDNREWTIASWDYTKQIMPLLGIGVVIAGFLLGSTHDSTSIPGIVPNQWVSSLVGGNSLFSNFFASFMGAMMYFATLTEIPIPQGLMASGMGKGPALALLLAGPSLSLPNILVIRGILGTQKTIVYTLLVIIMATLSGLAYGFFFG